MAAAAPTSSQTTDSNTKSDIKCVICGDSASPKIIKDDNFITMMCLYWEGIQVDVKPHRNKDLDLCTSCFFNLRQFYETNDICLYFEENLKMLRSRILCQNLKGILKRHEEQVPLLDVHTQVQNKWGTKLEPMGGNTCLKGYKVNTYIETDKPENCKIVSATPAIVRETVSQSSAAPKEKCAPSTNGKVQKITKGRKPAKKKAKKSAWSSSSAEDTEELSSGSD